MPGKPQPAPHTPNMDMKASRQYCCVVRTTASLQWPWPTDIKLFVEQADGCLGCWKKTFVPVVSISVPPEKWKMLPNWRWENPHAEMRADFESLAAWDAEGRCLKVKVKVGNKTVAKRVSSGSSILCSVKDGDFNLQENTTEIDLLYGLSVYLVKKSEVPDDSEGRAAEEHSLVPEMKEQTGQPDVPAVKTEERNDAANTPVMKSNDENDKANVARHKVDKDTEDKAVAAPPDIKEGSDDVIKTTLRKTLERSAQDAPVDETEAVDAEVNASKPEEWRGEVATSGLPSTFLNPETDATEYLHTSRGARPGERGTPTIHQVTSGRGWGSCWKSVAAILLWITSLMVAVTAPVLLVYVTVVPLLEETVPFLASQSPLLCDATAALQLLFVGLLLLLSKDFYGAQLARLWLRGEPRQGSGRWCEECAEEVAVGARHCMLCGECVEDRQHHSVLLNTCIGASNTTLYHALMRRLTAGSVVMLLMLYLEEGLGQPWRPLQVCLLSFFPIFWWHCGSAAGGTTSAKRCKGRNTRGSRHQHVE